MLITVKKAAERFSAISLFTGAGGLDVGLEAAAFAVRAAVEVDAECKSTLQANRDWPVIQRCIHQIPSEEILRNAGLKAGKVDLLFGGPPCQPFSKSGYWANGDTRRLQDPRASTLGAFLRILNDVKPRAFLIENVAGLAYAGKDDGLQLITGAIDQINREGGTHYSVEFLLLNAVDFGVPQIRQRAFLIGARDGTRFGRLSPTHFSPLGPQESAQLTLASEASFHRTAWDALWDLENDNDDELRVTGKWANLLPSIPEGSNYLYHTEKGEGLPLFGWRRRFWNFLLKLAKGLPSWTITASPGPATGPFHWKNRRLSVRELARLQTFPDNYRFVGPYRSVLRQIGNAVPCALAEEIGLEIRRRLFHDSSAAHLKATLVPDKRSDTPTPEPVAMAPDEYKNLIGKHEPHPGTGKGYGARERNLTSDIHSRLASPAIPMH